MVNTILEMVNELPLFPVVLKHKLKKQCYQLNHRTYIFYDSHS
jgi:hypothetical protein